MSVIQVAVPTPQGRTPRSVAIGRSFAGWKSKKRPANVVDRRFEKLAGPFVTSAISGMTDGFDPMRIAD